MSSLTDRPQLYKIALTYSRFTGRMLSMFTRILPPPKNSVFLFGPRGTGKTTWIKQNFAKATFYDLLNTSEVIRLSREPSLLFRELQGLPKGSWVVIDEIQKVPSLLNEVHRLIEEKKLRFVLSGSSARKLRRGGANLLAGRATQTHLFPLVSREVDFNWNPKEALQFGMLPSAFTRTDKKEYLMSYAETYLQEEIRAEALTRNIGSFARFLEIAARQNGQITNVSSISRDAAVARQTVDGFFEILQDTLLGDWLRPWKLKRATKQVAHPKFYLFDPGVARALSGRLPYPPTPEESGHLLETLLLNELRAFLSYSGLFYPLHFWSSHDQVEVDFFVETQKGFIAIECKSAEKWDGQFGKGLKRIREEFKKHKIRTVGIYMGPRKLIQDDIEIFPLEIFLKGLWNGEFFI